MTGRGAALMSDIRRDLVSCFGRRNLHPKYDVPGRVRLTTSLNINQTMLHRTLDHFGVANVVISHAGGNVILNRPSLLNNVGQYVGPLLVGRSALYSVLRFHITLRVNVDSGVFHGLASTSITRLGRVIRVDRIVNGGGCTPIDRRHFRAGLCRVAKGGVVARFRSVVCPILSFIGRGCHSFLRPVRGRLRQTNTLIARHSLLGCVRGHSLGKCGGTVRRRFELCSVCLRHRGG